MPLLHYACAHECMGNSKDRGRRGQTCGVFPVLLRSYCLTLTLIYLVEKRSARETIAHSTDKVL